MKHELKFLDYTGTWPCACYGTLTFSVDGTVYEWDSSLSSGGRVRFDDNWCEHVEQGDWSVEFPEDCNFDSELKEAITEMVNDNVDPGCCGGCV